MALKARTVATRGRKKSGASGYKQAKSSKYDVETPGSSPVLKKKKRWEQDTY